MKVTMLAQIKIFLLITFCSGYLAADEEIIVSLPDGKVKGLIEVSATNTTFYSFQGIPYAQPPINELRFQAPEPVEPWDDVYDATYEKNICYQVTHDRDDESEDCLYVNVYTPKNPSSENDDEGLPVMFFIYGGGFVEGSSERINYGPHHLMDYDVVLVTFNYRVGPFGFFSTGDSAIPGNAGLKDQNFALQWVQKNIKYFGGDPEKVTVFGQSAGGASLGYHILSPLSKGLFRAGIAESGSFLSSWAYQRDQVAITYKTAGLINSTYGDLDVPSNELLEFLLSVDAKDLDDASDIASESLDVELVQGFSYAPVVEHEHHGAFITKKMYDTLDAGEINKVPIIIGIDSEEALFFTDNATFNQQLADGVDEVPSRLLPDDMHIEDDDVAEAAEKAIKELYVGNGTFGEDIRNVIKFFSDTGFTRSVIKHAELQSKYTDVYFYQFSYQGVLGGQSQESVDGFSDVVRHGEELGYIFSRSYEDYNTIDLSKYPEADVVILRRVLSLFTNFARVLNPTPEKDELFENIIWPTVESSRFFYLDIGSTSVIRQHPKNAIYKGWNTIFDTYAVKPYDTF